MRPEIPEEVAEEVERHVESQYGEAMARLPFADKVKLVLRDAKADMNHQTAEGQGEIYEGEPVGRGSRRDIR
jgi:hypothetical protein